MHNGIIPSEDHPSVAHVAACFVHLNFNLGLKSTELQRPVERLAAPICIASKSTIVVITSSMEISAGWILHLPSHYYLFRFSVSILNRTIALLGNLVGSSHRESSWYKLEPKQDFIFVSEQKQKVYDLWKTRQSHNRGSVVCSKVIKETGKRSHNRRPPIHYQLLIIDT